MSLKDRPSEERINPFNGYPELLTDVVFLIGNGTSREGFDLERLRGKGTIIGCNALYREFAPDLLLSIDAKLLRELRTSGYAEDHLVLIPGGRTVDVPKALHWRTTRFNTSGCFGMKLINQIMKPTTCYMIGMDCFPGNIYDNTANYATHTLQNFSGILTNYMNALNEPGDTIFVNVNEKDAWGKEAHDTGKYQFMEIRDFVDEVVNKE